MTTRGEKFLKSLKDGRKVWLEGQAVDDLPTHPAFQGTLKTITGLFDLLDDPHRRDEVGYLQPSLGRYVHSSFLVPYSKEDILTRSKAFTCWAKETNGIMSRLSDYGRSMITGWYADREEISKRDSGFQAKIEKYYESARDNDLFLTTAILDPQIDRSRELSDERISERFLHVVKETSEGIIVRGAKMIATGAPYTHDFIIFSFLQLKKENKEHSHVLIVPANSKGLHIVCRESFADSREKEHILSSRYEEMDAVLFFDDVLIPWERVLLYGDSESVLSLRNNKTANSLAFHQTVVRSVAKLEFVTGLAFAISESIGVTGFLHIQEKLGELLTQVDTMRALVIASETKAAQNASGVWLPEISFIDTARNIGTKIYPRAIEILQQVGGGGFVQTPSSMEDFYGPISKFMHLYFEGASVSSEKKVKLFKLAWDLIGSPLGSRHELYERFYAGDPVRSYANQYLNTNKSSYIDPIWKLLQETSKG
ncbi:4-hydroxyphenylacetate 3-hydroxylase [Paenibacillus sp. FSL A5-0031]|uniref:4-hydroxyphenylacetate 3-hydroxylase family protein n=1 Tax=Paenibacillus sp. FSL A5-0031 TaxID=1920420 RepID=UPI00096FEC34|nr:4-hydroxyphenylacetate 3-hydroxylase N-terminal domain-containing protein [Paenibacillus sp. FSL A5-0031]OME85174.1 4-hydroxyphenylacetate 3-hydroxylase [Paenibacillus sp. FSL A5-0031]